MCAASYISHNDIAERLAVTLARNPETILWKAAVTKSQTAELQPDVALLELQRLMEAAERKALLRNLWDMLRNAGEHFMLEGD